MRELHSSELQVRGGAGKVLTAVFEKIRNLIDTIADYLPNFLKGLKDGFLGKDAE
ncbi:MAG: hypothetical protein J6P46_02875 [Bacteroidales bacterium]|nr:hypothetical protein [Bacteroidales bacterium]